MPSLTVLPKEQHRALNAYLNALCAESQQPPRTAMFYDHPRETDTFYSLTAAGEANLSPSIRKYLNPKHRPRIRITTSQPAAGAGGSPAGPPVVKRRIIKSRIADFDVLCPALAFDYRISISIESPFDGPDDVLVKVNDGGAAGSGGGGGGGDREKDRVSYRHLAYQIDLTQVSYPNVRFNSLNFPHSAPGAFFFGGHWFLDVGVDADHSLYSSPPNANMSSKSKSRPRRFVRNWRICGREGRVGMRIWFVGFLIM